jgi:hypothetical protein
MSYSSNEESLVDRTDYHPNIRRRTKHTHKVFDYETDELIPLVDVPDDSTKEKFHDVKKTHISEFYHRVIRYFERLTPSHIDYSSELFADEWMRNVEKSEKKAGFFERLNRYFETLSFSDSYGFYEEEWMRNVEKSEKKAGFFERLNRYFETLSVSDSYGLYERMDT